MEEVSVSLAIAAGLLSFVSPCVLPLAPAYIGYMGGRVTRDFARQSSSGAPAERIKSRVQMLLHGLAFVAGFTAVFVLIGFLTTALASIAGGFVGALTETIGRLGGLIIILFGLQFMGVLPRLFRWLRGKGRANLLDSPLFGAAAATVGCGVIYWGFAEEASIALPLCALLVLMMAAGGAFTQPARFWSRALDRAELLFFADTRGDIGGAGRGGLLGSALMGVVFSAGWTPCIGPLLGAILTLAATSGASGGDIATGMLLLTAYSIGLGIPFVLTALLLDSARGLLRRLQRHMRAIERFSGALLIVIGLLVASGRLQSFSQTFSRGDFADFTFRMEECGLGYLEGTLGISHVRDCLEGSLLPVSLGQSVSAVISPDIDAAQIVFAASAGDSIDLELRGISDGVLDIHATLFAPDETTLAWGDTADSLAADGKLYPLVAVDLAHDGLYRVLLTAEDVAAVYRFRARARRAEPITTQAPVESTADSLTSLADGLVSDLAAIVADLGPAVGLAEGQRAPDFEIASVDGEALQLSQLRGKVVLLNFWGTWCGPCRREMPEFQKFYADWREAGFEIVAVAWNDSEDAIRDFRDEYGLTFPLALDKSGDINERYAVQTRPSSYIIDRDGIIHARHFGIMTEPQLRTLFRELFPTP